MRLDDHLGEYLPDLTPDVSNAIISQLLSHSAGLTRDWPDSGQFSDRRPFLSEAEFRADLSAPQSLAPGVTFKYSNHGFALLGKVIEKVAGEPYGRWIHDHVVAPADLAETTPDSIRLFVVHSPAATRPANPMVGASSSPGIT
ncbi:serine hydrolase domain-containing protein [Bradyrhizobium sp. UFLA06-06]